MSRFELLGPRRSPLLMAALLALVPATTGCTAMSRGLGKMTANKYASPQSGTVWTVPPPQLEPPSLTDKTAYVSFRNISDAELDLLQLLKDAAREQGWTLVDDPQDAKYRLRAQARFFGEVDPDSGGRNIASKMGWISGAAVGVGTYALVSSATDSWAAGAVAGVAAGGLMGAGIANASKPREWALIIDIVLEEFSSEEIEFELLAGSDSSGSSGGGAGNSRMADSGSSGVSNSSSGAMKKKSNYFPHGVRLSAWANQMNMQEDEAMPLILERTKKVVTELLPQ